MTPSPAPFVAPKVLVLNFDPLLHFKRDKRLHEVCHWNDPRALTDGYIADLYHEAAPGEAGCGNVHFAPNSERDYDWGNRRVVWSTCDDWLNYPDLTGQRRPVNCEEWGGGDIRAHHRWWLRHLPRAPGRTEGKLNNWWAYVVDPNLDRRFPESQ